MIAIAAAAVMPLRLRPAGCMLAAGQLVEGEARLEQARVVQAIVFSVAAPGEGTALAAALLEPALPWEEDLGAWVG